MSECSRLPGRLEAAVNRLTLPPRATAFGFDNEIAQPEASNRPPPAANGRSGESVSIHWARLPSSASLTLILEHCPNRDGGLKTIACVDDTVVIEKIFAHLDAKAAAAQLCGPQP